MVRYQKLKGMVDILPGESEQWQHLESTAQRVFQNYQYHEIRTPLLEQYDVFARSSGDSSDIVSKEMYDFQDKGQRHVALRPEGTAGVVRAYVENKLFGPDQTRPYKVWYHGPMFRYERPQSGRQRQFYQIGVEALGSDRPEIDVETIAMASNFLQKLGLVDYKIVINTLGDQETRQKYHQALVDYLEPLSDKLSVDSQIRLHKNPLRILDSKDSRDQKIVAGAPSILDYLTTAAQAHFDQVQQLLKALDINYEIDHNMVRGLDYYNHTIFEIMITSSAFGNKEMTLIAGGRYNGLVAELGGPDVAGVGFGMGVERLLLVLQAQTHKLPPLLSPDIYLVTVDETVTVAVAKLLSKLRWAGISAERDYLAKKVKSQFKQANRLRSRFTLTLGEQELASQTAQLKRMQDGQETLVHLDDLTELIAKIKKG